MSAHRNPISPEEIQRIIELRATGLSVNKIAEKLRRSSTGIWYRIDQLKKAGVIVQEVEKQEVVDSDQLLIELFDAGLGDDQIALKMNIAEGTVRYKRSGLGLSRRKPSLAKCAPGSEIVGTRRRMLCEAWI